MNGFGLARLKMEGCAMHPDDILLNGGELTDKQYIKQLEAYEKDTGDLNRSGIIRDDLTREV